jgi:hypothetical protein
MGDIPSGVLPASLAGYDVAMKNTLVSTLSKVDSIGLAGIMTFGLYPRYWGDSDGVGEVGSCSSGPNPNNA